jgi:hypothetical protein
MLSDAILADHIAVARIIMAAQESGDLTDFQSDMALTLLHSSGALGIAEKRSLAEFVCGPNPEWPAEVSQ